MFEALVLVKVFLYAALGGVLYQGHPVEFVKILKTSNRIPFCMRGRQWESDKYKDSASESIRNSALRPDE